MFEILHLTYGTTKAHVAGCKDVKRVVSSDRIETTNTIPDGVQKAPCIAKAATGSAPQCRSTVTTADRTGKLRCQLGRTHDGNTHEATHNDKTYRWISKRH